MKTSTLGIIFFVFFSSESLFAQVGQTGFSFLKIGVGSRALSMGEAATAAAIDPSATHYNPAALSLSASSQLLLMHREWIQDSQTDYIGATTSAGRIRLGIAVNSTSIDNIEVRTTPGPAQSTFTARNASLGLSAAYDISPDLSVGTTGKFLYEKILIDEASGFAFDIGAIYRTSFNVILGAAINNLGSVSELRDAASKLPTIFRFGGAYQSSLKNIDGVFTGSADIVAMSGENKSHLHFGGEMEFKKMFAVRAGFQTGYEAKNVSAGVGLRQGILRFDYAFIPFSFDLGSTHTISVGIDFP